MCIHGKLHPIHLLMTTMNGKKQNTKRMKTYISLIVALLTFSTASAQNSFEDELFSAKTALKYRAEISLSEDQIASIQDIYSAHIAEFEIMRFDLDAELVALDRLISVFSVDEEKAVEQMLKVLRLEESLKRVRLLMLIRIKNVMNAEQQARLKELRTENDIDGFLMSAPINNSQKVTLQLRGVLGNLEPLYILKNSEGEREVSRTFIQNLDASEVETINVIKGEAARQRFGERGKNGVVYIEIKLQ